MKTVRRVALMLALAVWLTAPVAKAAPVDDFLNKAPAPFKELAGSSFSDVLTPPSGPWSATTSLFGMPATTVYLYWVQGSSTPVVAIPLPFSLTADKLFHVGAGLDIGVSNPILFWVPEGVSDLVKQKMPGAVPNRVSALGLTDTVQVTDGFNLFGRVASGSFLDSLLTPLNLRPANLTAGIARGKDGVYITSLLVTSPWYRPFGLADTSITAATVRVTKDKTSKTVEAWGTASVKTKPYTVYLQRDDTGQSQTLGFDTKTASLEDFFVIAGVVSTTLHLPAIPWPNQLPLNRVTISNPKYDAQHDPRTRPDFTRMMFQGSMDKGQAGELNLNAAASAFGWTMAEGKINASPAGVVGDVALAKNGKIGPIEVPSASFYLKVNPNEQAMGIKAHTLILGDLDLKADVHGLKLVAPPSCPLRPVGFTAVVSDMSSDFPITPTFDDCFSKALEDLAHGVEGAYKETEHFVSDLANDSAATAEQLGRGAVSAVQSLHLERAAAWPVAIVAHAVEIRSAQDVARAAGNAVHAAQSTVSTLADKIYHLDDTISGLAKDIENLLGKLWGAITGDVKKKKAEKAKKVSERDHARAQKAAAEARLAKARRNQANKDDDMAGIPGPYITGKVAELEDQLLGTSAQAQVQPRLAEALRDLPSQLKNAAVRKEILGAIDLKQVAASREASLAGDRLKVSDLYQGGKDKGQEWLADAKKSLIAEAVGIHIGRTTESLLREAVGALPTMTHDEFVRVVAAGPGPRLCMEAVEGKDRIGLVVAGDPHSAGNSFSLKACKSDPNKVFKPQKFMFMENGVVSMGREPPKLFPRCFFADRSEGAELRWVTSLCKDSPQRFFYDPIDGFIRYQPDPTPRSPKEALERARDPAGFMKEVPLHCVQRKDGRVIGGPCPAPGAYADDAKWVLMTPAEALAPTVARVATRNSTMASKSGLLSAKPQDHRTNLAPLELK
jgi:hypothetical protein